MYGVAHTYSRRLRPGAWNAALPAHLKILELIETGKGKAASRAMLALLSGTMADIDDVLGNADADMPVALAVSQPSLAGADNG